MNELTTTVLIAPAASALISGLILWQVRRLYKRIRNLEELAESNADQVDQIYRLIDK